MLANIFDAFIAASPVSVMFRGVMERVFRPERLDEIFEQHAETQYTRELLFSSLVDLLSLVVCGIHPSVNAAYKAKAEELNVTRNAIYAKLNGVEPMVSAALLRATSAELGELIYKMGGGQPPLLEGYSVRILDGKALRLRRVLLRLAKPTRHGDAEIVVLTNLPATDAGAQRVVQLYRERWQIEGLFLTVTQNFEGEIETLAYPRAALSSFSLALTAYNLLATLRAAHYLINYTTLKATTTSL